MSREQLGMRAAPGASQRLREVLPRRIPRGYVVEAWPTLYRRTLAGLRGQFTAAELSAMLDVSNGTYLTAGLAGQHLPAEIADFPEAREKWGIDPAALASKIAVLTPFEICTLELWCQSYWDDPERNVGEYVAALT
ncbi:MAG: hypothetical protein PHI18_04705 [bacterium]|nr:hypothetical protein [bacterium]